MDSIDLYTRQAFGPSQREHYLNELEACFARLAAHPWLGSACDWVRPGLRQLTQGRHIVFYLPKPYGVRIVRVLHERIDLGRQTFSDEDR